MSNLVRGTFILTAAIFISKILGFIYVVPFKALVGTHGFILYNYAYQPYIVLLSLTTMGIPLAISKFVSKYNQLGDYQTGRKLVKSALVLMIGTGFISFLLLFFCASHIALFLIDPVDSTGNSLEDVTFVIRMVSFALLIVPVMGVVRGYFQGHQSMGPTAVSQVIEQVTRVIFILIGSFLVLHVWRGSVSVAVGLATFGAFIGAIGGLVSLYYFWRKRRNHLEQSLRESTVVHHISISSMYKELVSYAIPFVFVGLAIPIYNFIDTFTINQALMNIGYQQGTAEEINAVVGLVQKIVLLPVALATAMGLTLIPTITKTYTSNNRSLLYQYMSQSFLVILYVTLPFVIYFSIMSYPIYSVLFGFTEYEVGGKILRWFAPTALLFSLFTLTSAILLGVGLQRFALLSMLGGLVLKGVLNIPLIMKFEELGPIFTTNLGFLLSISLHLVFIHRLIHYKFQPLFKKALLISGHISLVVITLLTFNFLFEFMAFSKSYLSAAFQIMITFILSGVLYIWLGVRTKLIFFILGKKASNILDALRLKIKI